MAGSWPRAIRSPDFAGVFTHSPIGPVEQSDYRGFLTKLGVSVTESAQHASSHSRAI